MEAFFNTFKAEELHRRAYHAIEEFKKCVDQYIEFNNNERPHSHMKYSSPNTYESTYFEKQMVE